MTTETRRRILESIAECDRFIAKESPRSADLRPADVAQRLEFSLAHRQKLIDLLAASETRRFSQTDVVRFMSGREC